MFCTFQIKADCLSAGRGNTLPLGCSSYTKEVIHRLVISSSPNHYKNNWLIMISLCSLYWMFMLWCSKYCCNLHRYAMQFWTIDVKSCLTSVCFWWCGCLRSIYRFCLNLKCKAVHQDRAENLKWQDHNPEVELLVRNSDRWINVVSHVAKSLKTDVRCWKWKGDVAPLLRTPNHELWKAQEPLS